MSYGLSQKDDHWYMNHGLWPAVLRLGVLGGWKPAGTVLEYVLEDPDQTPVEGWSGQYTGNEGQYVTDDDARALADGLENLLSLTAELDIAEVLDESAEVGESTEEFRRLIDRRLRHPITAPCVRDSLRLIQGEEDREGLRAFALFCRREGFMII